MSVRPVWDRFSQAIGEIPVGLFSAFSTANRSIHHPARSPTGTPNMTQLLTLLAAGMVLASILLGA
jgi:hypothetical protein